MSAGWRYFAHRPYRPNTQRLSGSSDYHFWVEDEAHAQQSRAGLAANFRGIGVRANHYRQAHHGYSMTGLATYVAAGNADLVVREWSPQGTRPHATGETITASVGFRGLGLSYSWQVTQGTTEGFTGGPEERWANFYNVQGQPWAQSGQVVLFERPIGAPMNIRFGWRGTAI